MTRKILVIGAGPGGYPAAIKARELGADVTLVESADIGGVCLNRGCIPSKSWLDAGHRIYSLKVLSALLKDGATELGSSVSWRKVQERRRNVVLKLRTSLQRLLESKKIEIIAGTASFAAPGEAAIKTEKGVLRKKFDSAIIAAGTRPFFPSPFDSVADSVLDSDRVFELDELPSSFAVIGGGAIGCEFSCFFNALGCSVDLVEMTPGLIPEEDEAAAGALGSSFEKRGIKLHLGRKVSEISAGKLWHLKLDNGKVIRAGAVIISAGRSAGLENLGLAKIGLEWGVKGIKVDDHLRTQVPGVFAVGDVNGLSLLAHAASAQGEIAAANVMGGDLVYDNSLIPKCLYSWPEVASVGLNRRQAQSAGIETKVRRAFFASSGKAMTCEETEGFVQIVSGLKDSRILGAQIVGGAATEMIHVFLVAIKNRMKTAELAGVVFAHPTMSETIRDALVR